MADIAPGFLARQWLQVISAGDSLCQLAEFGAVEQLAKFRLPDQNDLQQLLRGSLEIGQQPDLFQHLGGQILRLVHDHDDAPAAGVGRQQPPIQRIDHLFDAVAVGVRNAEAQLFANGEEKLDRRHPRIQYDRDVGVMRNPRQQGAHHGGFTRADFPGQLNEAPGFVDSIQQMRQSFGVTLAQIEIARVRRDGEGLFIEPKEAQVHEP